MLTFLSNVWQPGSNKFSSKYLFAASAYKSTASKLSPLPKYALAKWTKVKHKFSENPVVIDLKQAIRIFYARTRWSVFILACYSNVV